MNHLTSITLLMLLLLSSCNKTAETAQSIVDKAIAYAGVDKLANAEASFTFRKHDYHFQKNDDSYVYKRSYKDSNNIVTEDILSNDGFTRKINDSIVELDSIAIDKYSNSLNSVIYFAFLPLWLNDAAVNKELIATVVIKEKSYHKIKVSFSQEGGGQDFQDIFYYWFDAEDYSMDYLAYSYATNNGGMRYRVAFNARRVNGVVIQDYYNLKPILKNSVDFQNIDRAYEEAKLSQLSLIELSELEINLKPNY